MYKKINKAASDSWDDISRQVYGTPDKGGDISKLNNDIESGEILVLEDDETNSDDIEITGEVYLIHGDKKYNDFSEFALLDGLEAVKGATFIFNKTEIDYNFSFNDSVTVVDEEGLFFKGRIANIKAHLTSGANWFQIEVKSHAGILTETNLPNPFEFTSRSIKSVLEQIAAYYNQDIEFSSENELDEVFVNEIGTSFTAQPNETVWDFMKRICHSRGLMITDTGNGLFIGRYEPDAKEKLNLIDGVCLGVEEIHAEYITVGLARYYEANSQYPSSGTSTAVIPFPIPILKRFDSNDYNALDLSSTAEKIACQEIGKHFKITVLLSENLYIKSGSFAVLQNPKIKIDDETDFVIETVERRHPDVTILTLVLPCTYTYEIPDSLPLC